MSAADATATLDWYGCATFRLRTAGLTIMLDAYIDRVPNAPGTGLTADAIDACDWIVVGHSHFDHLWGAERIMANTNATLIASYESVRVMEAAGVPLDRMICVAGGETIDLGRGVSVDVFPSQHSCVWSHARMSDADEVCLGDLGVHMSRRADQGGQHVDGGRCGGAVRVVRRGVGRVRCRRSARARGARGPHRVQ